MESQGINDVGQGTFAREDGRTIQLASERTALEGDSGWWAGEAVNIRNDVAYGPGPRNVRRKVSAAVSSMSGFLVGGRALPCWSATPNPSPKLPLPDFVSHDLEFGYKLEHRPSENRSPVSP